MIHRVPEAIEFSLTQQGYMYALSGESIERYLSDECNFCQSPPRKKRFSETPLPQGIYWQIHRTRIISESVVGTLCRQCAKDEVGKPFPASDAAYTACERHGFWVPISSDEKCVVFHASFDGRGGALEGRYS